MRTLLLNLYCIYVAASVSKKQIPNLPSFHNQEDGSMITEQEIKELDPESMHELSRKVIADYKTGMDTKYPAQEAKYNVYVFPLELKLSRQL